MGSQQFLEQGTEATKNGNVLKFLTRACFGRENLRMGLIRLRHDEIPRPSIGKCPCAGEEGEGAGWGGGPSHYFYDISSANLAKCHRTLESKNKAVWLY